ncbi:hypothetical protein MBLNU457_1737t1 [Dothideomycetes sp. NU457]
MSLSQAVHARRSEFVKPKTIRIKVGTWNAASFKGTERDIGGWFVGGKGISDTLTGLQVSDETAPHAVHDSALDDRETVDDQEARYKRRSGTLPKNDPGSVPGNDEIDIYMLGLQEIIDVNSATEALRPFTDPEPAGKWKAFLEQSLPKGYILVAEQQLIGMLLLIYVSPKVAPDVKSVSTTSVGTGLMGYMGNKGAVTARLVLGETTRVVFINCHMNAGTDKGALERRNWDYGQILSRTRFEPIQDSMDLMQTTGETIDDADFAFWVGDLNYRLTGVPGDDVRRLLMIHTRNEYDLSRETARKVEHELHQSKASSARRRQRSSTDATTSSISSDRSSVPGDGTEGDLSSSITSFDDDLPESSGDPASLQTTLDSLLPHDELTKMIKARKAFHEGWQEGPITFLPTYKYDPGSVGVFDSSEKKRAPSWCDRIMYRSRRDKMAYEQRILEEEAARKKDAEMQERGIDKAGQDEEMLYEYDPEHDAADEEDDQYDEPMDAPEGIVITKEGFQDEMHLDYYAAHQRVLSSDHKPLDAVFTLKYDAVVPDLKVKVHQEVARELDKAENEGRPSVTVVVDKHTPDDIETSDDEPAKFEGVWLGHVRYGVGKHRTLTVANTGRVPATITFVDRPVGAGQQAGVSPVWLTVKIDEDCLKHSDHPVETSRRTLEPGDSCSVELSLRIMDPHLIKAFNEGIEQLDDILVLRVENGRDHFIPVRGKWLESSLGRSIDKLIRLPEGGIRRLQHQRPKDKNVVKSPEVLPVKWSAPRELFRLTEATEILTEAVIAEFGMVAADQKPPWNTVAGWPFIEESWTATSDDERADQMAAIGEALDSDTTLSEAYNQELSKMQQLESLAAYVLQYIHHVDDGVVTEAQWKEIDEAMHKIDHEKRTSSIDEQRTMIQEIMSSSSSAHSISFILLTSMLDRILNEIVAGTPQGSEKPNFELPASPAKRGGSMRRKEISKNPAIALRQITARAFASMFGEAMIRAPEPSKGRDKAVLAERRTRLVEMFLNKDIS